MDQIDYKALTAAALTNPPKTPQQRTAELQRLHNAELERIQAMGSPAEAGAILAKERDAAESALRAQQEAAGRKADAERVEAWRKAIADREAQLASAVRVETLTRQAEALRVYENAMAQIEERRKTDPLDIEQGAATLELRKQQQAKRDDIALHETRVKLAGGQPGRY